MTERGRKSRKLGISVRRSSDAYVISNALGVVAASLVTINKVHHATLPYLYYVANNGNGTHRVSMFLSRVGHESGALFFKVQRRRRSILTSLLLLLLSLPFLCQ
jgi:hypothetical protein